MPLWKGFTNSLRCLDWVDSFVQQSPEPFTTNLIGKHFFLSLSVLYHVQVHLLIFVLVKNLHEIQDGIIFVSITGVVGVGQGSYKQKETASTQLNSSPDRFGTTHGPIDWWPIGWPQSLESLASLALLVSLATLTPFALLALPFITVYWKFEKSMRYSPHSVTTWNQERQAHLKSMVLCTS